MKEQNLRSNLKTAFQELVNGEEKVDTISINKDRYTPSSAGQAAAQAQMRKSDADNHNLNKSGGEGPGVPDKSYSGYPLGSNERTKSVLAKDVEIIGSIKSGGDIDIYGTVKGDVFAAGRVLISGAVNGNIECEDAKVENGQITGQTIKVINHISVERGSNVTANISASSVEVSGIVNGTVIAKQEVAMNQTAVLEGDVSAQYITVQKGAKINGSVKIVAEDKPSQI